MVECEYNADIVVEKLFDSCEGRRTVPIAIHHPITFKDVIRETYEQELPLRLSRSMITKNHNYLQDTLSLTLRQGKIDADFE